MPEFSQQFMDQIDAEVLKHCPRLSDDPTFNNLNYLRNAFTDWFAGWDAATEVAALIAAERQATPTPSDEALGQIVWSAMLSGGTPPSGATTFEQVSRSARDACIAAGAAVRDALGAWPSVPEIPEGWELSSMLALWNPDCTINSYEVMIDRIEGRDSSKTWGRVKAYGPTPQAALAEAVRQAREVES